MSAYYAVAYNDRVEILMDGVSYKDDGTIAGFHNKVWVSDRLPMAFAGRGSTFSVQTIGNALGLYSFNSSFDETFLKFKERIEAQKDRPGEKTELDGIVAGISETLGPVIYYFHTYKDSIDGIEPWKFYDAGGEILGAPCPTPQEFKESQLPMHWACDGLDEYGGEFFELVRSQKAWLTDPRAQNKFWGIGGHVDHTVISTAGNATRRIWEWPDQIGENLATIREAA